MGKLPLKLLLGGVTASLFAVLGVAPTLAHEHREVGDLEFVVGWKTEPALSDASNAVSVRISDHDGRPVTGVSDLKVEVSQGNQKTEPLALRPVFNSPGEYSAPLIPTRPGGYTFRFVGTIAGRNVDEWFTSGDSTFDDVANATGIMFPARDPSRGELTQRLERSDSRTAAGLSDLRGELDQASRRNLLIASVGAALGLLGAAALVAVLVLERRRRRASTKLAARASA